jgi:hypothetical protein
MTIHPAKTPMEGGFSLEKFMPNTDPETASAFAQLFDEQDSLALKHNPRPICPSCGDEVDCPEELFTNDNEMATYDCETCGTEYRIVQEITITYSTEIRA